jgi:hypothetical protein
MGINHRVDPLPFLAIGHVRMVAECETKTIAQYLARFASFNNRRLSSFRRSFGRTDRTRRRFRTSQRRFQLLDARLGSLPPTAHVVKVILGRSKKGLQILSAISMSTPT